MKTSPLPSVYRALLRTWGPQHWWPGRTRLEVVVGAVLTQNTAWGNVEKAIAHLRRARALTLARLRAAPPAQLARWIRPSGYFRVKTRRLKALLQMIVSEHGSLPRLFRLDTPALRAALLAVRGIGPETADSILLYAAGRPVFVVDNYTRRFMTRHGWLHPRASYDETAAVFTRALPRSAALFNEFHALMVRLGKTHCRKVPRCQGCPLRAWLPRRHRPLPF